MKIAITSMGPDLDSGVDQRFGRAKYFLVVDTESGEFTVHNNEQNLNATQGAGIQSAKNVAELQVKVVITGNVGPKAFAVLQSENIEIYTEANGTVREAMEQFKANQLRRVDQATVEGHWI